MKKSTLNFSGATIYVVSLAVFNILLILANSVIKYDLLIYYGNIIAISIIFPLIKLNQASSGKIKLKSFLYFSIMTFICMTVICHLFIKKLF